MDLWSGHADLEDFNWRVTEGRKMERPTSDLVPIGCVTLVTMTGGSLRYWLKNIMRC